LCWKSPLLKVNHFIAEPTTPAHFESIEVRAKLNGGALPAARKVAHCLQTSWSFRRQLHIFRSPKTHILHALSAFYRRERPKESACAPTVRIADQNVNENRREGEIVDMLNIASSGRKTSGKAGGKAVASSRK